MVEQDSCISGSWVDAPAILAATQDPKLMQEMIQESQGMMISTEKK